MQQYKDVNLKTNDGKDRIIRVYEIRPKDLIDIYEKIIANPEDAQFKSIFQDDALPIFTNADPKVIMDLYPSEMEELIKAFKSVNAPFLRGVQKLNLDKVLEAVVERLRETILQDFSKAYSDLRKRGIENQKDTGGEPS